MSANLHPSDLHGVNEQLHPVWTKAFNRENRAQQIEDDLFAGRSVSRVLTLLVSAGALLSLATLLVILAMQ